MKSNQKLIILIALMVIGIVLLIWGNIIMFRYDGYREVMRAARHAALPQMISGIVILCVAYILTYTKNK